MSHDFESVRNTNSSEEAELTPEHKEQKARQKIVEYLKDASLESARFQAYADYADLQRFISRPSKRDANIFALCMLEETIRQRKNGGIRGYKKEFDSLENEVKNYKSAVFDRKPQGYLSYIDSKLSNDELESSKYYEFSRELQVIKDQEIERKS